MNASIELGLLQPPSALQDVFRQVRAQSVALAAPLSPEDCCVQSMPDASPIKWHLAHTSWFFETFILERFEPGFRPCHPAFRVLFNSYYNGVGDKYPRPQRGLLTRPSLAEVLDYRHEVDRRIGLLLAGRQQAGRGAELASLLQLGLQHEQQHQELMQTDLKHLLSRNPLAPAAYGALPTLVPAPAPALQWLNFGAQLVEIGHAGDGFCFDNETPRHRQFVEPFALASRLVTNRELLAFIEAGGYDDPALWLAEGWDWRCANDLTQPLYWRRDEQAAGWQEFTLQGLQPLDLEQPALHLSLFEADAYARWAEARLPTEFEWEMAAVTPGLAQLFGVAWQWTSSSYAPYPGYAPAAGAIGEYNGKFMVNQYVLRGSSRATPAGHARRSYRNFFPAGARWQFSGIRLARSGTA